MKSDKEREYSEVRQKPEDPRRTDQWESGKIPPPTDDAATTNEDR